MASNNNNSTTKKSVTFNYNPTSSTNNKTTNNNKPTDKPGEKPESGTVAKLRAKFEKGGKASNPSDYAQLQQQHSKNARAQAALYNMQLRGAQVHSKNAKVGDMKRPANAASTSSSNSTSNTTSGEVSFELHEFTDEWQEYPVSSLYCFNLSYPIPPPN
jgi:hypothetical protein